MADGLRALCSGPQISRASFPELRLQLFFMQRTWRHVYQGGELSFKDENGTEVSVALPVGPDETEVAELQALHAAICDAWEREWPAHAVRQGRHGVPSGQH